MKSSTTRILVFLAAALFCFIFFFESRKPSTDTLATTLERLLPGFEPASVTAIDLLIHTNQPIRVEKAEDAWRMTVPVRYTAQTSAIEQFLASLENARYTSFITPRELLDQRGGLASFGLEQAPVSVTVRQGASHTEIRIGAASHAGKRLYVQIVGRQGVFIADPSLLDTIPSAAAFWRDNAFFPLAGKNFDRITLKSGPRLLEFEMDRPNKVWRLTKPMTARADNTRLQDFIRACQAARVAAFASDNPAEDLEPYGLRPPRMEISFATGTNEVASAFLGKSPTNTAAFNFALRPSGTNVVVIQRDLVDRATLLFTDFRDTRLATFSPAAVDRVEIRGQEPFTILRTGTNQWRITDPTPAPADAALVREFFSNLETMEIAEFVKDVVTDYSSYGLAKPTLSCLLFSTSTNAAGTITNTQLAGLDFGVYTNGTVFVRRTDESAVYAIRKSAADKLPFAPYQMRDRRIFEFASTNVLSIEASANGKSKRLARNQARVWSLDSKPLELVEAASLEETVIKLGELRAEAWVAQGDDAVPLYGITPSGFRITAEVAQGDKIQTLAISFGAISPMRRPYAHNQSGRKIRRLRVSRPHLPGPCARHPVTGPKPELI